MTTLRKKVEFIVGEYCDHHTELNVLLLDKTEQEVRDALLGGTEIDYTWRLLLQETHHAAPFTAAMLIHHLLLPTAGACPLHLQEEFARVLEQFCQKWALLPSEPILATQRAILTQSFIQLNPLLVQEVLHIWAGAPGNDRPLVAAALYGKLYHKLPWSVDVRDDLEKLLHHASPAVVRAAAKSLMWVEVYDRSLTPPGNGSGRHEPLLFILLPYLPEGNDELEHAIEEANDKTGLKAIFLDDEVTDNCVVHKMFHLLEMSKHVVIYPWSTDRALIHYLLGRASYKEDRCHVLMHEGRSYCPEVPHCTLHKYHNLHALISQLSQSLRAEQPQGEQLGMVAT